jgi:hypothetical protein
MLVGVIYVPYDNELHNNIICLEMGRLEKLAQLSSHDPIFHYV